MLKKMIQSKDTDWLNRYKNTTHIYAAYKRLTSDLKTHKTKSKGMEKRIFHANGNQTKAGAAILMKQNRL